MGNQSMAETLSNAGIMAIGLRSNLDKLKRRGLDEGFITTMEGLNKEIVNMNAEQEAIVSRLKEKTTKIEESLVTLKSMVAEARKVVKLEMPQPGWREFGISGVR